MALGRKPIEIVESGSHKLLVIADTWERVRLDQVADVRNGFAFKSTYFNHNEGMPLIRIRDISNAQTENLYSGEYEKEYLVERGDILIGMDGDFNCARWIGNTSLLNQRVCKIIPVTGLYLDKFLFLCLQPYLNAINEETSSITVKHLSSRTIQEIPLPLPPINEQHRIVTKIEELFSELDKGIESLKRARGQLKVYRQALLKHAFEGKLTEQWRKENADNLETADQLLERIKKEREARYQQRLDEWQAAVKQWEADGKDGKKPSKSRVMMPVKPVSNEEKKLLTELPETWLWTNVSNILTEHPSNGRSVKDQTDGFPVLRLTALKAFQIDLSEYKNGAWTRNEASKYIVISPILQLWGRIYSGICQGRCRFF
jgi:type I restriction enzyme S subunit